MEIYSRRQGAKMRSAEHTVSKPSFSITGAHGVPQEQGVNYGGIWGYDPLSRA